MGVDDGDLGEVKNFLASSSDEENDEAEDKDAIAKYKALIAEINDSEERKASEKGNLEVSWNANAEEEEQKDEQEDEEVAPWEKYLKKKREKKKNKKEKSKNVDDE